MIFDCGKKKKIMIFFFRFLNLKQKDKRCQRFITFVTNGNETI